MNCPRIWRRVAPSARRSPISVRRSSTEITMMFATPMPPTSSATLPRPSRSPVKVVSVTLRAAIASDGRSTSTSPGELGLAVGASTAATGRTWLWTART